MTGPARPLVSVVTPFYNSANYLDDCIRSVVNQTYPDWEYILLDNMSSDDSLQVARRWAARDQRIRVVCATQFLPQIPNYNRALREMSTAAKYCKIVQADDWIMPTCLEAMVALAETSSRIAVVGSYTVYQDQVGHTEMQFSPDCVLPGRDAIRLYLVRGGFLGSPTCVMYRADLVRSRERFFHEEGVCEDVDAALELLLDGDLGFVFQVLTWNRRENESLWSRVRRFSPIALHSYLLFRKYGHIVMAGAQYSRQERRIKGEYYAALARGLLATRDPRFWSYHRAALTRACVRLDYPLLLQGALRECGRVLASPSRIVQAAAALVTGGSRHRSVSRGVGQERKAECRHDAIH